MTLNDDFSPPADPWGLFRDWFALAESKEPNDPNAMAVATVGADGMPSVRILLLKEWDARGFVFFTNRQSRKGEQLSANPRAALCFHWKSIRRQIRAEGTVAPVTEAESDAYFAMRPRGSQIGAWASPQSQTLKDRATLESRVHAFEVKYEGQPVPRPPHWGGYRLTPRLIEFWQDRDSRLHDRFVYHRSDPAAPWTVERQAP